jgi:hypothetical protein
MDDSDPVYIDDFEPIPPVFYSFAEEGPFRRCVACDKDVVRDDDVYVVQKTYANGEVVFEYALCAECHDRVFGEMSKTSMANIRTFFTDRVDLDARRLRLQPGPDRTIDQWIGACATCGIDRDECEGYSIAAACGGEDILFHHLPLLVCQACELKMQDVLSTKTREIGEDFVEAYFDGPPADVKIPILF